MPEELTYEDFMDQATDLVGHLQRTTRIQTDGIGSSENTAQFHNAEEALFDLIALNRAFWDAYVALKPKNEFIQNLKLPF